MAFNSGDMLKAAKNAQRKKVMKVIFIVPQPLLSELPPSQPPSDASSAGSRNRN